MAPRIDNNAAQGIVQENFGLTADDLGMNPREDSFLNQNDDLDIENDDIGGTQDLRDGENDDLTVQNVPQESAEDDLFLKPAQQQQHQQQQPQPKPLHHKAEVYVDKKGNLVSKSTGKIVATAGREARLYQDLHKSKQSYVAMQAQYADQESRLNKAISIGQELFDRLKTAQTQQTEYSPEKYGLNGAEAIEALNFAKEAKQNPVETIKKLLTKAAASGIDLTSIGLSGGNFDPKSLMDVVRGEIDKAMNPLRERSARESEQERQTREQNERDEAAKSTLTKFLGDNPEAREYLPVFQRIYQQPQFQNMSLGEVWSRLQLNLMRRQQQASNQRPANQRNSRQLLPNGRRMPPMNVRGREELAPVSMDYNDIVREILGS